MLIDQKSVNQFNNYSQQNQELSKNIEFLINNNKQSPSSIARIISNFGSGSDVRAELVREKAISLAKTDEKIRDGLENYVRLTVPSNIYIGRNKSFKSCDDFHLASLLLLEKNGSKKVSVFHELRQVDPERLDRLNQRFNLGLEFDLKIYLELKNLFGNDDLQIDQCMDLFLPRGDVKRNAKFYETLLAKADNRYDKETANLAEKLLWLLDRRINNGSYELSRKFDKIFDEHKIIEEVKLKENTIKLDERMERKLNALKTGREYDDKQLRDLFTGYGRLRWNVNRYTQFQLAVVRGTPERSMWASKVLEEFHQFIRGDREIFNRLYPVVDTYNKEMTIKYKELPTVNLSENKPQKKEVIDIDINDDESVEKFMKGEGGEAFLTAFTKKLIEVSWDSKDPLCDYARVILNESEPQQVEQAPVPKGRKPVIKPDLTGSLGEGVRSLLNGNASKEAIDAYALLNRYKSDSRHQYHAWASKILESSQKKSPELMKKLQKVQEVDLGDKGLNAYVAKVILGQVKLTSNMSFCGALIDIRTDPNHPKSDWVNQFMSDCENEDSSVRDVITDMTWTKTYEEIKRLQNIYS